ncbi:MAG: DUF3370 family protein [cyanobacterium endosymbiont of Rhopalodia inflata]
MIEGNVESEFAYFVKALNLLLNGRSAHVRFDTNGNAYVASLAKLAPLHKNGKERQPTPQE